MNYTAHKIDGQNLMFHIIATHNNKEIEFNVVCASNDSEIENLVLNHLNFLDNPPVFQQQKQVSLDMTTLFEEQQAIIESLKARLDAANL